MKGIVLRAIAHKESDLIVSILTSTGMLVNCIARGARRSKKRFGGGVLEPTHYISFHAQDGRGELKVLSEANLIDSFANIRTDYDRLEVAYKFLLLVKKCAKEELENIELFYLLGNALQSLQTVDQLRFALVHFKIRLLGILGILPEHENFHVFTNKTMAQTDSILVSRENLSFIEKQVEYDLNSFFES